MEKLRGSHAIAHNGGINGFSTYAVRLPHEKVYVALLTNSDSGIAAADVVGRKAAAVAIGKPFPELTVIKLDKAVLDAFVGTYKVDDATKRVVHREGDRLFMQRSGRAKVELFPASPARFFMKDSLVTVTFGRDANGRVDRVMLQDDGVDTVNHKSDETPVVEKATDM